MKKYNLVDKFAGYVTKPDETNTSARFLVAGTENMLIDDQAKISTRDGYELDGPAGTSTDGIKSSYTWDTSSGVERPLRSYDDKLQFRYVDYDGNVTWETLEDEFSAVDFEFTTWWDSTTGLDRLLFVNGGSDLYEWNGAVTELASATSTTITKKGILEASTIAFVDSDPDTITDSGNGFVIAGFQVGDRITVTGSTSNNGTYTVAGVTAGTITLADSDQLMAESAGASVTIVRGGEGTWAEGRFNISGTKTVEINGTVYTYTGGETTGTLTGVTPDPSGEAAGSVIFQPMVTNSDTPASGYTNDVIGVLNNHIYIGSNTHRDVYVSANDDYTDYTFSSPRVVGEGALLTIDSATRGFVTQEEAMYISSGKDDWYRTKFTLSDDITKEQLDIEKLKTAPLQGARSQSAIANIKNNVAFISYEPTLDTLGRLENLDTPQSKPLSDRIKPDFDALDFTDVHVKYWRNAIYLALPAEGKVYIYDLDKGFWQPPQRLSVSRFEVYNGKLYGHASGTDETYEMFKDGIYTDNGGLITYKTVFAYRYFGDRANLKNFDEYYFEGYITPSTTIEARIDFDYQGSEGATLFEIDGSSDSLTFGAVPDKSIGKDSMGKESLGSSIEEIEGLKKLRAIKELKVIDFYEMQLILEATGEESRFQILAQGPNARLTPTGNFSIKF